MMKTPKRPRDLNQWAKRMVDIATGNVPRRDTNRQADSCAKGRDQGRPSASAGSHAEARSEIAQAAAHARWKKS